MELLKKYAIIGMVSYIISIPWIFFLIFSKFSDLMNLLYIISSILFGIGGIIFVWGYYKVGVFPINEKDWIDVGQWEEYRKSIKKLESVLE